VLYARWTERQPHGGREGGREGYTERMERGEVRERQAVRGGGAEDGESVHTDELEGPFGNRLPEPQYTHTHKAYIYYGGVGRTPWQQTARAKPTTKGTRP
jgi:hypothetical protein